MSNSNIVLHKLHYICMSYGLEYMVISDLEYMVTDMTTEITLARSQLWPLYKSERAKYHNSKVYIEFPAKLVVRGQVIKDLIPDWHTILRGSRHRESGNI